MNRTFKVVFNKARGALMVANETTCSVQKRGLKPRSLLPQHLRWAQRWLLIRLLGPIIS